MVALATLLTILCFSLIVVQRMATIALTYTGMSPRIGPLPGPFGVHRHRLHDQRVGKRRVASRAAADYHGADAAA